MTCTLEEEISTYLQEVKNIINSNQKDLIISLNRKKNLEFIKKFGLSKASIIDIINQLTIEDFKDRVANEHPGFSKETLYIFGKMLFLENIYGELEKPLVYIKFNKLMNKVILISFHEAKYKFKEKNENEESFL